jgi:hypothetical protein
MWNDTFQVVVTYTINVLAKQKLPLQEIIVSGHGSEDTLHLVDIKTQILQDSGR